MTPVLHKVKDFILPRRKMMLCIQLVCLVFYLGGVFAMVHGRGRADIGAECECDNPAVKGLVAEEWNVPYGSAQENGPQW